MLMDYERVCMPMCAFWQMEVIFFFLLILFASSL